ncbi:MAG: mechanosensitive ion channel family protein, partial [Vicinamibacterales bacterium]
MQRLDSDLSWVLEVFAVVVITLMAGAVVRYLLRRAMRRAEATKNIFDDVLSEALLGPSRTMIWIIGIAFAAHVVGEKMDAAILTAIRTVRDIGIIVMIMWFALRFVKLYEVAYIRHREAKGEHVDRTFVTAISKLVRAAIVITGALVV